MNFYNEALEYAKEKNVELSEECKELLLEMSLAIQNMTLKEQKEFLEMFLKSFELNYGLKMKNLGK